MDELLRVAGALLGLWVGYRVLIFVVTWVAILRASIGPLQTSRHAPPSEADLARLTSDQRAWLDELQSLGFSLQSMGWMTQGAIDDPIACLRHERDPVIAQVTFSASPMTGYPVQFVSEDAQGRLLITLNRVGWLHPALNDGTILQNVYVSALADHFAAHQAHFAEAVAIDPGILEQRTLQQLVGTFDRMRDQGLIRLHGSRWHYRALPAARAAWRFMAVRKQVAAPYRSLALTGEHLDSFLAQSYLVSERYLAERGPRHSIKALVLVLSMGLSLVFWGWSFDWTSAVTLIAVLLVHEGGHALAMRCFGWKDMSMFFIPFMGAVVTGRPSNLPAWKHALILLAGPVPGLLAGLLCLWLAPAGAVGGVNWQSVAVMAISVNLFNLLPINPLDGGQLLDVAVFARWPRLRGAVWVLSWLALVGLAVYLHEPYFWGVVAWVALMLPTQWRMARLQPAPGLAKDRHVLVVDLLRQARTLFPRQTPVCLLATAKAVLARGMTHVPRWWESAGALGVLLLIWGGVALAFGLATGNLSPGRHETDARSEAQRRFDEAWYSDEDEDDSEETEDATLRKLGAIDGLLSSADPRHVDLAVRKAQAEPEAERRTQMAAILRAGQDGEHQRMTTLLSHQLDELWLGLRSESGPERLAGIQAGLVWAGQVRPGDLRAVIPLRLREAEAVDQSGDLDRARNMLTTLRDEVARSDDCRCETRALLRAQTWFHLSHSETAQALQLLETSPYIASIREGHDNLSADFGWTLLQAGQRQAGLDMLTRSAYSTPYQPSWAARMRGIKTSPPWVLKPLDLAYALDQGGQHAQAVATLRAPMARYFCQAAVEGALYEAQYPWQQLRDQRLQGVAKAMCPAEDAAPGQTS